MVIVFVGGGTLGHIYPALPVIRKWKKQNPLDKIIFITTPKENEKKAIDIPEIAQSYYLDMVGFNRKNICKNLKLFKLIPKTNKLINDILEQEKPDVVIGMGGYLSGVVLKQAQKRKIKTIIHEQNSVLGIANKWVLKKALFVLSSFPLNIKRTHFVIGNPRQDEANEAKISKINSRHILVVSGSQGAEKINEVMIEFLKSEHSRHYTTTLVTGKRYYDEVINRLVLKTTSHYQIIPFTNQMFNLMNKADLIVSRAGATTLFEIIGMEKPSIIIPSPNVSNNHQTKNATMFEKEEIGIVINEKDLTMKLLEEKIKEVFKPNRYQNMVTNLKKLNVNRPTQKFIEIIERIANHE